MSSLSIAAVKSLRALLATLGRGGSLPGSIGLKIDPQSIQKLDFNGPVILVTGTNGKTSTSNLISSLFEANGYKVLSNRKGDNMLAGIASTLLSSSTLSGKLDADVLVLEVDELNMKHIVPKLPVSDVLITNFFRDQLDRAFEMDQLIQSIENALKEYSGDLILNGNDPNSVRIPLSLPKARVHYFGVGPSEESRAENAEASEGKFCPNCGHPLEYDYYHYSHIGKFHCPVCDFKTPALDVELQNPRSDDQHYELDHQSYTGPYEGMYSIYNYAALHAIAKRYNLSPESIRQIYSQAPKPFGRNESFQIHNHNLVLNLVKNPTGANEVIKVIEKDHQPKTIIIVLNDKEQDGTDVSWIYDTHFEHLASDETKKIITTGTRAYDMALRMFYEGFSEISAKESFKEALQEALGMGNKIHVIATYTALMPTRNEIVKNL